MTASQGLLARALSTPLEDLRDLPLHPVRVAVIDSGIDASHPDLAGRVEAAFACDADESGAVHLAERDPTANNDTYGHGTAVGSIIAGIAPNAVLTDVRVLGGNNRGGGEQLILGLAHAVKLERPLINMSLAAAEKFRARLTDLCEQAYRNATVIVASRRNMPIVDDGYPASLLPCVGVDNAGEGPELQFRFRRHVIEYAANGGRIVVAAPGGGYTTLTGTSFATPRVTGVVALLLGAYPGLNPFEVKAVLKAFAMEDAAA